MQKTENKENIPSIPFPDEIAHLEEINQKLDSALAAAETNVERIDREYMDAKRYMAEHRGDIDPHEMFQNELNLRQIDYTGAFAVEVREKTAKLKDSPYFARIDFCAESEDDAEAHYIGRFAFNWDGKLLISDWRSPIASMFYDCEIGPAEYTAPVGKIRGDLTRKRQFKIRNGKMEYALETSMNIQDDILQQELSHTSDEKMKSIIATIQKEQNQIIRNERAETLIIQGVAGSGKTSIALHRIAFLLYRLKDRLSANNVTILSPNKVFGDYISNVLPELGEEPIYELGFADIAKVQLERVIDFEVDKDPMEAQDAGWKERVRFKSSLDFVKRMDAFILEMPDMVFEPEDYAFGRFVEKAQDIMARFLGYGKLPIKKRLEAMAEDMRAHFETENYMGAELPKSRAILKALKSMLKVKSTLSLYKMFFKHIGCPKMFVMAAKKTLEWADVYPFLYLHTAYEGLMESRVIRHVVVDEMQDYTPIQYGVIKQLFPCQKTILGDFGQFINPNHQHTLEDILQLFDEAAFVEPTKSYRSTYEIISFARRIAPTVKIDAIERHGEMPRIVECPNVEAQMRTIQNRIKGFAKSPYSSLGIIAKTNELAKMLYDQLSREQHVHFISPESTRFESGISVTSIQMAKGLEFDEVIVPFADQSTYHSQYDSSLLYIACTRAMHRLTLFHSGPLSPLLQKNEDQAPVATV